MLVSFAMLPINAEIHTTLCILFPDTYVRSVVWPLIGRKHGQNDDEM